MKIDFEKLANQIMRRKEELGLSRNQLAKKAGMTSKTLLRIERGENASINIKWINKLAEALEVTPDELLGKSKPIPIPVPIPESQAFELIHKAINQKSKEVAILAAEAIHQSKYEEAKELVSHIELLAMQAQQLQETWRELADFVETVKMVQSKNEG
jgi:transcriptional regulator with XRE-family HTH domain